MHYGDYEQEYKHARWLDQYAPGPFPALTERNLRHAIARANQAEEQLAAFREAARAVRKALSL